MPRHHRNRTRKTQTVRIQRIQTSAYTRDIRAVFDAVDRIEADRRIGLAVTKPRESAPDLTAWIERSIPEGLTVFTLPVGSRKKLRTSNLFEGLNKEIRRRTRVAPSFPTKRPSSASSPPSSSKSATTGRPGVSTSTPRRPERPRRSRRSIRSFRFSRLPSKRSVRICSRPCRSEAKSPSRSPCRPKPTCSALPESRQF